MPKVQYAVKFVPGCRIYSTAFAPLVGCPAEKLTFTVVVPVFDPLVVIHGITMLFTAGEDRVTVHTIT